MDYRDTYIQAVEDLKSGGAKEAYKKMKNMANYNPKSKILDIKKGPLLGKYHKDLKGLTLTNERDIADEIRSYLQDHYGSNQGEKLKLMDGGVIQIKFQEVLNIVKYLKGGKATSTDCIPDTFMSYRTLKGYLKDNKKIIRITDAIEKEDGFLGTRINYLQERIARNLTELYNYWLSDGGIPIFHTTARNFFVFKSPPGA